MNEIDTRLRILVHSLFVALGIICVLLSILLRDLEAISDLLINIGATLIATSLLAYLYQTLGTKSLTEQLRETQQCLEIMGKSLELGITDIWKERRHIHGDMWNKFTKDGRHEVWLYGVAEYGFASDEVFHQIMADGAARGCTYKILLLDPASPFAEYWDDTDKTGIVVSKICAAIQKYQKLIEQNKGKSGRIELRVYDEAPSLSIVRADEEMLVTLYVFPLRGDDCLTLQVRNKPGGLFARYLRQFDRVWNAARVSAVT
jgi:hypothetical protein